MTKIIVGLLMLGQITYAQDQVPTRIGSKIFTEGYILAEILAVQLEYHNFPVTRMAGLGATGITEAALKDKKIDLIVDYTGSIARAMLHQQGRISVAEIRKQIEPLGFTISDPLGFNNTYTLATRADWAQKYNVKTFSDLKKLPIINAAFTPEFASRSENWPGLKSSYFYKNFVVKEMDHQLAYQALKAGDVDVIEAYSTDAKLKEFDLTTLSDDQHYFPNFDAVILTHLDWVRSHVEAWQSLQSLVGKISEKKMVELNSQADLEKKSFQDIAHGFLKDTQNTEFKSPQKMLWLNDLQHATMEHLLLTLLPVFLAFLVGVPLAYMSYLFPQVYPWISAVSSIFQTIPSLAFFTLLIPFVGVGTVPALAVLFLYGLLPIFISSHQGFSSISELTNLSCLTLGLKGFFKFKKIELPLALPAILAGLQTSLITTVGTATIAALIGAGGYGKKIIAGLAVNDMKIVLFGALPAASMALFFQFIFQFIIKKYFTHIR